MKRKNEHKLRGEKNPPVVKPLFMFYRTVEMIGMKEWERTKQFNLLALKNVLNNQFTNVYVAVKNVQ